MTRAAQSYIICTSPRSGSTLFCGLLKATGHAGAPGSHFHVPTLPDWLDAYGLDPGDFASDVAAIQAVVEAAITKGTGGTDVFGLRLQRKSFAFFMAALDQLHPGCANDTERLMATFGPFKLIHLERQDKLAQSISRAVAEQSGLWHRNADGTELERDAPQKEPRYDHAQIAEFMAEAEEDNAEWRDWFAAEGLSPHSLTYEALSKAPRTELARALAFLNLDPSLADTVAIPTAKLADARNAEWARRFRADQA